MSSAGLILLQDALEIIFLSMLVERDVDEQKPLESKTFDELIGELKKVGVTVPKSGTLKALNKQRVITKHYGQLAEPLTVQTYAEAVDTAVEAIVLEVLGSDIEKYSCLTYSRTEKQGPFSVKPPHSLRPVSSWNV